MTPHDSLERECQDLQLGHTVRVAKIIIINHPVRPHLINRITLMTHNAKQIFDENLTRKCAGFFSDDHIFSPNQASGALGWDSRYFD